MPPHLRCLTAALVASGLAACSGGDDGPRGAAPVPTPEAVVLTVTGADVHAVGPPTPFPEDVKAAVVATLNTYLDAGIVQPLRRGQPPAGVEAAFTTAAAPRLAGPDRAALVEEGTPPWDQVRPERAEVRLAALTGPGGETVVVTAQLDAALVASSPGRRLVVARAGELVLVPEGGGWRIDAFEIRAQRDSVPPEGRP